MELNDKLIVQGIKNGNTKVYQSLYDKYYTLLVQYAYRYVYDKEVSKDIVQDVFVELWAKKDSLKIKSFNQYLHTAVRNNSLAYLRHLGIRDKHKIYIIDYFFFLQDANKPLDQEIVNEVENILENLSDQMKRIYKLKYAHGLTMNEIAEDLNISLSTVKTQLNRARKKLKLILARSTFTKILQLTSGIALFCSSFIGLFYLLISVLFI